MYLETTTGELTMNLKKPFTCLALATLLIGTLLAQASTAKAEEPDPGAPQELQPAEANTSASAFGYTLQSGLDFNSNWKDIHLTGAALSFGPRPDDVITQAPALPFSFVFFENSYSTVYVSTNGFVTFSQTQVGFPSNYSIPTEFAPNNLAAGFWDDLTVGGSFNSGAVYFQVLGAAPNRAAVFEWYQVTRFGSSNTLTFEIILNENGNIDFNYADLNGDLTQATVGIEDADGVDGYQMKYNAAGLASNTSYRLVHPGNGARVKAKPLYQGGFLTNGILNLPVTLVNTGSNPDTFNVQLAATEGHTEWQIQLVDGLGNNLSTTPPVASRQAYPAFIRVTAPFNSPAGSYVKGRLTVISNANSASSFVVNFDAAVPAPFVAFYADALAGYAKYIMPQRQVSATIFSNFNASNFGMTPLPEHKYLMAWENNASGTSGAYENIKKSVMGSIPGQLSLPTNLEDNAAKPENTFDESPMTAVSEDKTIGMVFVRWVPNETGILVKSNVFFARLNAAGGLISPAVNLTNNNAFYADLAYSRPMITAAPGNQFVITFESVLPAGGSQTAKDINLAVVDSGGDVIRTSHPITDSATSGLYYYAPSSTLMKNGSMFLTFIAYQSGVQANQVKYTIYHPGSNSIDSLKTLDNASGEGPHAGTLSDGTIILAWVMNNTAGVGYTMFNPSGVLLNATPQQMASIKGWRIENISLTGEINGNAVITWKDQWGGYLYYALVAPSGTLITPPMAFQKSGKADNQGLLSSTSGQGTAPLDLTQYVFVPAIYR